MRGYFGQAKTLVVDFGKSNAGLSTVGYTLLNGDATTFQARTTTSVAETATGTGEYKVQLGSGVFSAAFDGYVLWDNGAASPTYATEDLQMVAAPPAGSDYTSARATKIDNLDATVSGVAASVWTVLTSTLTTTGSIGKLLTTNIDAAVSGVAASVWSAATSGLTTVSSIGKLLVTNVDAAVSTRSSHSVADIWNALTSGLTTAGSVGKWLIDKIDVVVSTRLASSDYTAPDNADVAAIKLKTDLIPAAGPADAAHYTNARGDKLDDLDAAVSTRLASLAYTAPDNATIASIYAAVDTEEAAIVTAVNAIKTKTDGLPVDPADASDIAAAFSSVSAAISALGTPVQDAALATAQAAIDALGSPLQSDDARVDHLDADVSSRSTYDGSDTTGTTTLLARLTSTRAGLLDNLDSAVSGVAGAVWAAGSRTLTALVDSSGVTTLLDRLSSDRADALDNLDVTVSSRATPADVTGEIVADLTPIIDELDAIKAQTDRIGSANVRLTSPVAAKSSVTLIQGDDYSALDGRSLEWHNTDGGWPDLTDHDVFFVIADSIQVDAEALDGSTVRVELTAENTSAIHQGSHEYEIYAHISDRKITLVRATVTVREVIHDAEGD